jgi:hypothetical protein
MLPLDGSIAEHVPDIAAAYARIVPPAQWPGVTVIDLTAGSCLLPLLFAAHGAERLVINDLAPRSQLAARSLFGGMTLSWPEIERRVTERQPRLRRHVPSFHFASDYLTEPVAAVFDRLYYAVVPLRERAAYRYLALRWVLGFSPVDDAWNILPTHDPRQLRDDLSHDWGPYLSRMRRPREVLRRLLEDINGAIARVRHARAVIRGEDMLTLCRRLNYGRRAFVVANPPTRGLDEYVIDDQLAHSLMENRWLPLSHSRETPEAFWRRRVAAALACVPKASHALVWGGDGAVRWRDCVALWERYGKRVVERRADRPGGRAGWAILERF